jgi:hypothetical protein
VKEAGAALAGERQDIGAGSRIVTVTDADGHTLGLIQSSEQARSAGNIGSMHEDHLSRRRPKRLARGPEVRGGFMTTLDRSPASRDRRGLDRWELGSPFDREVRFLHNRPVDHFESRYRI